MKFSSAVVLAVVLSSPQAAAFVGPHAAAPSRPALALPAHRDHNNNNVPQSIMASAVAAVVGWTLASQAAFAGILPPISQDFSAMHQAPSIEVAVDTMDFSLPTYGDAIKGVEGSEAKPKQNSGAPSFNPFGDFTPGFLDDVDKKVEAAAAETPKADEKAAAEAKKADEKAAAEAKKADEKAAAEAKKAEKEARLKAEKEKIEAAAASKAAAESAKAESVKLEVAPPAKAPAAAPAVSAPFEMPDIKVPEMDFKAPDMSKFKFDMPKMDMPKFDMPSGGDSKVDMPKIDIPDMSKFKFDMPKFDMPSGGDAKVDMPKVDMPKVNLPKIGLPKFDSSGPAGDSALEPRDIRDEKARQAKKIYSEADEEAQAQEQKARQAREYANLQKFNFQKAKDNACVDRPGGKLLCFRNPFQIGF